MNPGQLGQFGLTGPNGNSDGVAQIDALMMYASIFNSPQGGSAFSKHRFHETQRVEHSGRSKTI